MKKFCMVLTVSILLSQITSFCSQSKESGSTLKRTLSHDGTRKTAFDNSGGMFGSGLDTLEKLGQPFGKNHIYALGSDAQAETRWAEVGKKDIKTLAHAEKFVAAVTAKGWNLSTDAMQPSYDLIISDVKEKNNTLIQQQTALILAAQQRYEERLIEDKETIEAFNQLNDQFTTLKQRNMSSSALTPMPIKNADKITPKNLRETIQSIKK